MEKKKNILMKRETSDHYDQDTQCRRNSSLRVYASFVRSLRVEK